MLALSPFFRVELRKGGKRGKFNLQRVVSHYSEIGSEFFYQNDTWFCGCNSFRIGQNFQNEVSVERPIFADVCVYHFNS